MSSAFEAHLPLAFPPGRRARVEECWHLTEQNAMYETCLSICFWSSCCRCFATASSAELTPERCFHIQLLLIHLPPGGAWRSATARRSVPRTHWAGKPRASCASIFINALRLARWPSPARRAKARWETSAGRSFPAFLAWTVGRIRRHHAHLQIDGMTPVVPTKAMFIPPPCWIGDDPRQKGHTSGPTPACAAILAVSW